MPIEIEKENGLTVVAINRPDRRNAVDLKTAQELAAAFLDFDRDQDAQVAILTGRGGHFCAGADLKSLAEGEGSRLKRAGDGPMGPTRMLLSKPVIAAVEGYAVAGGIELALWCDLRVAAEDATFGVFCRRFGVPLVDGGTVRLPRLIGESRAMDLILTGRPVDAHEAFQIGLANRLAAPGQALDEAKKLAQQIMAHPSICMRNDRLSARTQWSLSGTGALMAETEYGLATMMSGESRAGAQRFAGGAGRGGKFDT